MAPEFMMRSPRKDRYTTPQTAKVFAEWMLEKQDILLEKLDIKNKLAFKAWVKNIQSEKSDEKLYANIHAQLHAFIGNHSGWPAMSAAFRRYQFDLKNPRIQINSDAYDALNRMKNNISAEGYSEVILLLADNEQLMKSSASCRRIWEDLKAFDSGYIYRCLYDDKIMRAKVRYGLHWETRRLMMAHVEMLTRDITENDLQDVFGVTTFAELLSGLRIEFLMHNNKLLLHHKPSGHDVLEMTVNYDPLEQRISIVHTATRDMRQLERDISTLRWHNHTWYFG